MFLSRCLKGVRSLPLPKPIGSPQSIQREHPHGGQEKFTSSPIQWQQEIQPGCLCTRGILLIFPRKTALPISQRCQAESRSAKTSLVSYSSLASAFIGYFPSKKQAKPHKSSFFAKISTWWCDGDDKENKYSWKLLLFHNVVESRENRLFREKIPFLLDMPGPTAAAEDAGRRWSRRGIGQRSQMNPEGAERYQ